MATGEMSSLTLARLLADPEALAALPRERIPETLGEIERVRAALWARLMVPATGASAEPAKLIQDSADRLLTVDEVAHRMGVRRRWLYDHAGQLPFTRRPGPRTLRFSEAGLRRWMETRR